LIENILKDDGKADLSV